MVLKPLQRAAWKVILTPERRRVKPVIEAIHSKDLNRIHEAFKEWKPFALTPFGISKAMRVLDERFPGTEKSKGSELQNYYLKTKIMGGLATEAALRKLKGYTEEDKDSLRRVAAGTTAGKEMSELPLRKSHDQMSERLLGEIQKVSKTLIKIRNKENLINLNVFFID